MMDISEEMRGYIDLALKMNPPRSERTVEFIQPAIAHGLNVLEAACPISMHPTQLRPVYGPMMDGGRYAVVLSTEKGGVFTTLTELLGEVTLTEDFNKLDTSILWRHIVSLLDEQKADDAMGMMFAMLQRQGMREKMLMNCSSFLKSGFVPLLFCVARCQVVEDKPEFEQSTGFFTVLPLPPSIERQLQVIEVGELDPSVIPTPKRRK